MVARDQPLRIAAWSGPRNISTAMMRAWENRGDTAVVDEPFYACYLARTGLEHPGRNEVIASQHTDWRKVAADLTGPVPDNKPVYYQKHMAHHVFADMDGPWLDTLKHLFLVREPARMLVSLDRVTPDPRLEDTGLPQQLRIFERVCEAGARPLVIDAQDVLEAPADTLGAVCLALGIEFTPRMLSWPAGPRVSDGVWAPHWYHAVLESTEFVAPKRSAVDLPGRLAPLLEECRAIYARLYAGRIVHQ